MLRIQELFLNIFQNFKIVYFINHIMINDIIWIIFIIKKIYNVYKIMINMIKYEKKKENSFVLKQIR